MKWLSNTYDPKKRDAKYYVARLIGETQEQAWANHKQWLEGKIIGEPMASETYSVEELKAMGMVGVYSNPMLSGKDAIEYINHVLKGE